MVVDLELSNEFKMISFGVQKNSNFIYNWFDNLAMIFFLAGFVLSLNLDLRNYF